MFLVLCAVGVLVLPWAQGASAQWRNDGLPVCTAPMRQEIPFILKDGRGGAFVAWRDQRDSAAIGYDIYIQRLDARGVPQWGANGAPVCTRVGDQINPQMASDSADGVIVAWQDLRSGTNFDIYAQRLSPSGIPLWTEAGVRLRNVARDQYLNNVPNGPSIIADGTGGAIVAWDETVTGFDSDIYAQRVDAAGSLLWTEGGAPVSTAWSFQTCPAVVPDGAGGAIITWEDWRFWPTA